MRATTITTLFLLLTHFSVAQYGTFDAAKVKASKSATTVVVLDGGSSAYDRAITDAVRNHWNFTGNHEFVTVAELGAQPIAADKLYLLKCSKVDPVKFEGTFLTLVQGWKAKKGDSWQVTGNVFKNIPSDQELANLLVDPGTISDGAKAGLVTVYVKHLQDYLTLVENGTIKDRTTADRTYASRNRLVRNTELRIATEQLDKTLPDAARVREHYTSELKVGNMADLLAAVEKQDRSVAIADVVLTVGDHRNKHCFKRIFNAGTGELMYLGDDQAIFGKKEGFIDTDLKAVERAR